MTAKTQVAETTHPTQYLLIASKLCHFEALIPSSLFLSRYSTNHASKKNTWEPAPNLKAVQNLSPLALLYFQVLLFSLQRTNPPPISLFLFREILNDCFSKDSAPFQQRYCFTHCFLFVIKCLQLHFLFCTLGLPARDQRSLFFSSHLIFFSSKSFSFSLSIDVCIIPIDRHSLNVWI